MAVTAAQFENAVEPLAVDIAAPEKTVVRIEQFRIACLGDLRLHLRKMPTQDSDRLFAVGRFIEPCNRTAVAAYIGNDRRSVLLRPGPAHGRDIALVGSDYIGGFHELGEALVFRDDVV